MTRTVLSLGNFFSAAHFYLIIYIVAPYLATFLPADQTGLVVSVGAVATLAVFPIAPKLVARYGARKLAIVFAIVETLALFALAFSPGPVPAMLLVSLACALSPLIAYQLDLLLEATVTANEESSTGRIRTAFLTAGNAALIIAPLAIALLLDSTDAYYRVFMGAAISLIPFIFLFVARRMPEGCPPAVESSWHAAERVLGDRDLRGVVIANFILQLFYHFAPLYIPLYLHDALGVPWDQLGWMFAVMLLPFVFMEYPAGVLADRYIGDKELMLGGFLIAGFSFVSISLIGAATPIAIILGVLVASRIGAALVEAMVEGHFFRRVSEKDASVVSVFRMARPVAALIAPLTGSLLLAVVGYGWMFVLSGTLIAVLGAFAAFSIKDFK